MNAKKMIKLINDERKTMTSTSLKGCDASSTDSCSKMDVAHCTGGSWDICYMDLKACTGGAYDYCSYRDTTDCTGLETLDET